MPDDVALGNFRLPIHSIQSEPTRNAREHKCQKQMPKTKMLCRNKKATNNSSRKKKQKTNIQYILQDMWIISIQWHRTRTSAVSLSLVHGRSKDTHPEATARQRYGNIVAHADARERTVQWLANERHIRATPSVSAVDVFNALFRSLKHPSKIVMQSGV